MMNTKFTIVSLAIVLCLGGCGKVDQLVAHYTGYQKICIEGVSYLQFTSGATAQLDINGKVVGCK